MGFEEGLTSSVLQLQQAATSPAAQEPGAQTIRTIGAPWHIRFHPSVLVQAWQGHVPAMPRGYSGMNMVYRSQVSQPGGCPRVLARYQGYLQARFRVKPVA